MFYLKHWRAKARTSRKSAVLLWAEGCLQSSSARCNKQQRCGAVHRAVKHGDNPGHLFFDALSPLITLLELYAVDFKSSPQLEVIFQPYVCEYAKKAYAHFFDERHNIEFISIFSRLPAKCLQDLALDFGARGMNLQNSSRDSQLVCFRRVWVGEGGLDMFSQGHDNVFYKHVWPFRDPGIFSERVSQFLVERNRSSSALQQKKQVTIIHKTGRRRPVNYPDMVSALEGLGFRVVLLKETDSKLDTIAAIQSSIICITPAGGLTALSIFLPKGATVVILSIPRQYRNKTFAWDYDTPMLQTFGHFNIRHYPVWPRDISAAQNASCDEVKNSGQHVHRYGKYVFCSYFVDTERLSRIVLNEVSLIENFKKAWN